MAGVLLKNVEKQYPNGFKAVHGINLEIKDGEFMVFVGPSGCAKSTTLRMIAGLEEITGGEIYIGDTLVNDVAPKDRGIAMVFQNYALYPHMTVYENMAFGLKLRKIPKDEINKRVEEAAQKLEIIELLDRKPKEMSGGQRQRVALGRALVRHPKVFLFDEPLSNLDAKLRVSMRVRITQLHKDLKTTMIYVTHDQVEAMTMGERITVLNRGRIMQVDTPLNLYHKPANKFVAGFIGSPTMNLIESELIEEAGKIYIKIEDQKILLDMEKANKVKDYVGKKVIFGIRPESISLGTENDVKGEITVVEQMGNEEYIYFEMGLKQWTSRINVEGIDQSKKKGTCYFKFDTSKCHIFDIETEENISL
ncbi:sn-glycerol-3-phosphate ABC transporter ATP-binding protein UgpC [uncultured Sneathia sp.]|uniref:ABC transporter ATP-binding protein n=1 Tax=uncultured Sneathia sp. TaxID=278067 RepID=UPI0025919F26|nr:sn-glycerol-3-phosphate ABC transporter ATP-binding protein UgpC [uncultured Sneathia sp.]